MAEIEQQLFAEQSRIRGLEEENRLLKSLIKKAASEKKLSSEISVSTNSLSNQASDQQAQQTQTAEQNEGFCNPQEIQTLLHHSENQSIGHETLLATNNHPSKQEAINRSSPYRISSLDNIHQSSHSRNNHSHSAYHHVSNCAPLPPNMKMFEHFHPRSSLHHVSNHVPPSNHNMFQHFHSRSSMPHVSNHVPPSNHNMVEHFHSRSTLHHVSNHVPPSNHNMVEHFHSRSSLYYSSRYPQLPAHVQDFGNFSSGHCQNSNQSRTLNSVQNFLPSSHPSTETQLSNQVPTVSEKVHSKIWVKSDLYDSGSHQAHMLHDHGSNESSYQKTSNSDIPSYPNHNSIVDKEPLNEERNPQNSSLKAQEYAMYHKRIANDRVFNNFNHKMIDQGQQYSTHQFNPSFSAKPSTPNNMSTYQWPNEYMSTHGSNDIHRVHRNIHPPPPYSNHVFSSHPRHVHPLPPFRDNFPQHQTPIFQHIPHYPKPQVKASSSEHVGRIKSQLSQGVTETTNPLNLFPSQSNMTSHDTPPSGITSQESIQVPQKNNASQQWKKRTKSLEASKDIDKYPTLGVEHANTRQDSQNSNQTKEKKQEQHNENKSSMNKLAKITENLCKQNTDKSPIKDCQFTISKSGSSKACNSSGMEKSSSEVQENIPDANIDKNKSICSFEINCSISNTNMNEPTEILGLESEGNTFESKSFRIPESPSVNSVHTKVCPLPQTLTPPLTPPILTISKSTGGVTTNEFSDSSNSANPLSVASPNFSYSSHSKFGDLVTIRSEDILENNSSSYKEKSAKAKVLELDPLSTQNGSVYNHACDSLQEVLYSPLSPPLVTLYSKMTNSSSEPKYVCSKIRDPEVLSITAHHPPKSGISSNNSNTAQIHDDTSSFGCDPKGGKSALLKKMPLSSANDSSKEIMSDNVNNITCSTISPLFLEQNLDLSEGYEILCHVCKFKVPAKEMKYHLYFGSLKCSSCDFIITLCSDLNNSNNKLYNCESSSKIHNFSEWHPDPVDFLFSKLWQYLKEINEHSSSIAGELYKYLQTLTPLRYKRPWQSAFDKCFKFLGCYSASNNEKTATNDGVDQQFPISQKEVTIKDKLASDSLNYNEMYSKFNYDIRGAKNNSENNPEFTSHIHTHHPSHTTDCSEIASENNSSIDVRDVLDPGVGSSSDICSTERLRKVSSVVRNEKDDSKSLHEGMDVLAFILEMNKNEGYEENSEKTLVEKEISLLGNDNKTVRIDKEMRDSSVDMMGKGMEKYLIKADGKVADSLEKVDVESSEEKISTYDVQVNPNCDVNPNDVIGSSEVGVMIESEVGKVNTPVKLTSGNLVVFSKKPMEVEEDLISEDIDHEFVLRGSCSMDLLDKFTEYVEIGYQQDDLNSVKTKACDIDHKTLLASDNDSEVAKPLQGYEKDTNFRLSSARMLSTDFFDVVTNSIDKESQNEEGKDILRSNFVNDGNIEASPHAQDDDNHLLIDLSKQTFSDECPMCYAILNVTFNGKEHVGSTICQCGLRIKFVSSGKHASGENNESISAKKRKRPGPKSKTLAVGESKKQKLIKINERA